MTGNGLCDYKMDANMDLAWKPLAPQKISISSSTGTGNGFVCGAIHIFHIALRFLPKVSQWCVCPLNPHNALHCMLLNLTTVPFIKVIDYALTLLDSDTCHNFQLYIYRQVCELFFVK